MRTLPHLRDTMGDLGSLETCAQTYGAVRRRRGGIGGIFGAERFKRFRLPDLPTRADVCSPCPALPDLSPSRGR